MSGSDVFGLVLRATEIYRGLIRAFSVTKSLRFSVFTMFLSFRRIS
jgi:hypothetical protein